MKIKIKKNKLLEKIKIINIFHLIIINKFLIYEMVKEINDQNFEDQILKEKGFQLVDFWAPWCGPCKQIAPLIEELDKELGDKISVSKCNVDESPEAPSKYMVRGIPTLILFKDGEIIDSKTGSVSKTVLFDWVKSNIE